MADALDLPGASSMQKMSTRTFRQKAQEFLSSRKYANNLVDIISQWDVRCFSPSFSLSIHPIDSALLHCDDIFHKVIAKLMYLLFILFRNHRPRVY